MFCCGICNVMFNGVYPETVLTTLCGHLFHSDCIQLCLKKSPKCPFCTLHVEKKKLIKINFQIDANWKDTAAALKTKANTSIISLDASMNESIRDLTLNNKSVIKIDSNQSISEIGHELPALRVNNQVENSVYSSKTLLTTGLSSTVLSKTVKYLLSIFNDNIPNSTIIKRELVSELTIVKTALVQGYTNIIIIVSLIPGDPVGLTFIDLVAPFKTSVALSSFECLKYISIKDKIELPHLVIDYKHNYFNESDGNIIQFFSKIFPKRYGYNHDYSKTINISYCYNCPALKFEFNSAGLNFCITPPSNIMG